MTASCRHVRDVATYPGGIGKYRDRRSFQFSKGKPSEGTRRSHEPHCAIFVLHACAPHACPPTAVNTINIIGWTSLPTADNLGRLALTKLTPRCGQSVCLCIASSAQRNKANLPAGCGTRFTVHAGVSAGCLAGARRSFLGPVCQMSSPGQATDQASLLLSKQLRGES